MAIELEGQVPQSHLGIRQRSTGRSIVLQHQLILILTCLGRPWPIFRETEQHTCTGIQTLSKESSQEKETKDVYHRFSIELEMDRSTDIPVVDEELIDIHRLIHCIEEQRNGTVQCGHGEISEIIVTIEHHTLHWFCSKAASSRSEETL